MQEINAILLIILLLGFGFAGSFRVDFVNLIEDAEEVEERIEGNQRYSLQKEGREDISRTFRAITGSSEVNLTTDRGNIFVLFKDRISGNAGVNIKSRRGDITLKFEENISGAARVNIQSDTGDILFLNRESEIRNFINDGKINVSTGGNINYRP